MAFKKAGGTARQNPDTLSRNLGVKFQQDEIVFPGHILVRQRGTKYHPGEHVGIGKVRMPVAWRAAQSPHSLRMPAAADAPPVASSSCARRTQDHTIFATAVGRVRFTHDELRYPNGRTKERTLVHVAPLDAEAGCAGAPERWAGVQRLMVERRALLKRQMLRARAVEAALHFPLPRPSQRTLPIVLPDATAAVAAPGGKAKAAAKEGGKGGKAVAAGGGSKSKQAAATAG